MRQQDIYEKTIKRLKRAGINTSDHESVVRELAKEIDYYRDKIKTIEQNINENIKRI